MSIKKILFLFGLVATHATVSFAQQDLWQKSADVKKKSQNTGNKVKDYKGRLQQLGMDTGYARTFLLGGKLNSDGWSGNVYFVRKKSYPWSKVWQIGFAEIKHEKQTKLKGKGDAQFGKPLPYVYGKTNNAYVLQIGLGHEKMLLPSVIEGNISVGIRYNMGLSLAMLKPYYLKLTYVENIGGRDTSYIEEHYYSSADNERFLNPDVIFGASKWQKGLNEIRYIPGAHFEVALVILPAKTKTFVQAIKLGINGAYFANPLLLMVDQKVYHWQTSLFAGLSIGKRW